MSIHSRSALAVLAVVAVFGAVYVAGSRGDVDGAAPSTARASSGGSPAPTPPKPLAAPPVVVPSAAVPTEWATYASSRFGYVVDHPKGWVVTAATDDWPNHHPPSPFGPTIDRFGASSEAETFVLITSDPLAAGQSPAERIAAIDFINAGEGSGSGCLSSERHTITLGGVEARQEDLTCFGTDHLIEVTVVSQGRIYLLDLFSRPSEVSPTDRATFERFLTSFMFTAAPTL